MPPPPSSTPDLFHLPGFYEPFSAVSHLLGAVAALMLGWRLVRLGKGDRHKIALLSVYAVSCALLLSMSAVFHMMEKGGTAREVMARLDHGAIFVLIAGTFTAVHGLLFLGWFRWVPIAVIWCITAACIALKTAYFTNLPEWVGLSFYLGMGWGAALTAIPILRRHGFRFLGLLACGGVAYSAGAIFEQMGWFVVVPGVIHAHELWHLSVLAGVACHWTFVWRIASRAPELMHGETLSS